MEQIKTMEKANCKTLPQGGTIPNEDGESTSASALRPAYLGGPQGAERVQETMEEEGKARRSRKKKASEPEISMSDSDAGDPEVWESESAKESNRRREAKRPCRYGSLSSSKESLAEARDEFLAPAPVEKEQARKKDFLIKRNETPKDNLEADNSGGEELNSNKTTSALIKKALDDVTGVMNVATKAKNLKNLKRNLKDSAASLEKVLEVLQKRTASEEVAILQAANERLENEVTELRKSIEELKNEVSQARLRPLPLESTVSESGIQVEELKRAIMLEIGNMVSARMEAYEERLLPEKRLRPPLAADRKKQAGDVTKLAKSRPTEGTMSMQKKVVSLLSDLPKGQKGQKKGTADSASAKSISQQATGAPEPMEEGWSTVTKRGGKTKKKDKVMSTPLAASSARQRGKPAHLKLRPPRSAAVVITLQPQAADRGVTYASVLQEARAKIDLSSCDISGLRFRKAATGGRILEIPGATSGEKADSLAQKLRENLNAEIVKVSRPTKCAYLRICHLDDSVSVEEVITAVAKRGGCPVELIKAGELRRDYQGTSTITVRCPIIASKKLAEEGRLLVGWVAAQVKLLQPRPLQCYRCLRRGHVRAQCTEEVDRSDECYQCGRIGHKAATCSATTPRCSLCTAANRPAEHRVGSKSCFPPKPKKVVKVTAVASPATLAVTSNPSLERGEEEEMQVN